MQISWSLQNCNLYRCQLGIFIRHYDDLLGHLIIMKTDKRWLVHISHSDNCPPNSCPQPHEILWGNPANPKKNFHPSPLPQNKFKCLFQSTKHHECQIVPWDEIYSRVISFVKVFGLNKVVMQAGSQDINNTSYNIKY